MNVSMKVACLVLAGISANATALPPERPKQPHFTRLYVEPSGALVAEVTTREFFRSHDGGAHWTWIPAVPDLKQSARSGLDPARQLCMPKSLGQSCLGVPETVGAADAAGNLYRCAGDRIEISNDGGARWQKTASWASVSSGIDRCKYMTVQGQAMYVLGEGLYRSTNHGQHWITVRESAAGVLGSDPLTTTVIGLSAGPGRTLYTTSRQVSTGYGLSIQASSDGGETWKRQTFGLPENWLFFMLGRVSPDAIYFFARAQATPDQQPALYRSVDGATAELMNTKVDFGNWVDVQTGPDGAIFILTLSAIHRSDDGGETWRDLGRDGIGW